MILFQILHEYRKFNQDYITTAEFDLNEIIRMLFLYYQDIMNTLLRMKLHNMDTHIGDDIFNNVEVFVGVDRHHHLLKGLPLSKFLEYISKLIIELLIYVNKHKDVLLKYTTFSNGVLQFKPPPSPVTGPTVGGDPVTGPVVGEDPVTRPAVGGNHVRGPAVGGDPVTCTAAGGAPN